MKVKQYSMPSEIEVVPTNDSICYVLAAEGAGKIFVSWKGKYCDNMYR